MLYPSQRILLAICTRNRTEALATCLQSVVKLAAPPAADVRILVIDNSEAPATREGNEAVVNASRGSWPIALEHEPQLGISFARNRALEAALALAVDAVVFLDDDQTVPEDWLAVLVRAWREEGTDAMSSNVTTLPREHFGRYDHVAISELQRVHVSSRRDSGRLALGTGGVLISRRIFGEFGVRFDPGFALTGGEDHDFFYRARLRGARLAITHETIAFEWWPESRKNLRASMKRGFRIGVCRSLLRHAHARSTAYCLGRGLWFLLTGLLTLPAGIWRPSKFKATTKRIAKGAGFLAGLCGYRFEYYRVVLADPTRANARMAVVERPAE
jgi:succinoglycan biosynthesis protein ExoM